MVGIEYRFYKLFGGFIFSGWYFIGPIYRYRGGKEKRPFYPISGVIPRRLIKPIYIGLELIRRIKSDIT